MIVPSGKRLLRLNNPGLVDTEEMKKVMDFIGVETDEALIAGALSLLHKLVTKFQQSPTIALDEPDLKKHFVKQSPAGGT